MLFFSRLFWAVLLVTESCGLEFLQPVANSVFTIQEDFFHRDIRVRLKERSAHIGTDVYLQFSVLDTQIATTFDSLNPAGYVTTMALEEGEWSLVAELIYSGNRTVADSVEIKIFIQAHDATGAYEKREPPLPLRGIDKIYICAHLNMPERLRRLELSLLRIGINSTENSGVEWVGIGSVPHKRRYVANKNSWVDKFMPFIPLELSGTLPELHFTHS